MSLNFGHFVNISSELYSSCVHSFGFSNNTLLPSQKSTG